MQYVGQTCRKLKTRFGEHYRKIKKPKKIDKRGFVWVLNASVPVLCILFTFTNI